METEIPKKLCSKYSSILSLRLVVFSNLYIFLKPWSVHNFPSVEERKKLIFNILTFNHTLETLWNATSKSQVPSLLMHYQQMDKEIFYVVKLNCSYLVWHLSPFTPCFQQLNSKSQSILAVLFSGISKQKSLLGHVIQGMWRRRTCLVDLFSCKLARCMVDQRNFVNRFRNIFHPGFASFHPRVDKVVFSLLSQHKFFLLSSV